MDRPKGWEKSKNTRLKKSRGKKIKKKQSLITNDINVE
jgi:hypothetical protein